MGRLAERLAMQVFAIGFGGGRQVSPQEFVVISQLLEKDWQHLFVRLKDRWIGFGQVVFDLFMQLGQAVVGHHREHVVLNMVVHVPIDEAADRVHQNGAGIQPVVEHIVGQPAVLQVTGHDENARRRTGEAGR